MPSRGYTFFVQGNYLQNSSGYTFGNASTTIEFTGGATSTIDWYAGTFAANLVVAKDGSMPVDLISDFTVTTQPCNIHTGTFDAYSHNFTCGGAFSVDSGGRLQDFDTAISSDTLTFGSTVTNNGMVWLDGGVESSCVSTSTATNVLLRSSSGGTQRTWGGTGKYVIRYTDVEDQNASGNAITDWNGHDSGDNTNWTFLNNQSIPELVQSNSGAVSGAVSTSIPLAYWPRSGDLIVVAVSARGQGILTPTDSAGNTYHEVTSTVFGISPTYGLNVYYANNVNSTSSFSVTIGGTSGAAGTLLSGTVLEYTGVNSAAGVDNLSGNIDTSGNAILLTSNNAQSFANEIMVGASTYDTATTIAAGTGWTPEAGISANDSSNQALYTEDMLPTSSVTTAATWDAVASTSYAAVLTVFTALPGQPIHSYAASGTLDSDVFDTKDASGAQLNSVLWQGSQPAGTSVGFQIAVSNSPSGPWSFIGPSGDQTTYFATIGPGSAASLKGTTSGYSLFTDDRYFRYRVILFSNPTGTATPVVNSVIVNWSP